jgi:hypothetical protein
MRAAQVSVMYTDEARSIYADLPPPEPRRRRQRPAPDASVPNMMAMPEDPPAAKKRGRPVRPPAKQWQVHAVPCMHTHVP